MPDTDRGHSTFIDKDSFRDLGPKNAFNEMQFM